MKEKYVALARDVNRDLVRAKRNRVMHAVSALADVRDRYMRLARLV